MMLSLILLLSALSGIRGSTDGGKIVPCAHWEKPSYYFMFTSSPPFTIDDLNVTSCTHLLYSSQKEKEAIENICSGDADVDYTGAVPKFASKKIGHPNLKVLLYGSLADWCLRQADGKMNFTSNIVKYLQANGFDGFADAMDDPTENKEWEKLVKELRRELEDRQLSLMVLRETRKDLTVSQTKNDAFILPNHCNYLTLLPESLNTFGSSVFTIEKCIQKILDLGVEPSKILIPLAFIGLKLKGETEIREPISKMNLKVTDYPTYKMLCMLLQDGSWKSSYDEPTKTALLVKDNEVIMFRSQRTVTDIANFIKQKQLGGLLVKAFEHDDYEGKCGQGKYPILSTIGKELSISSSMKPSG